MAYQLLFQTNQFSISTQIIYIWPRVRILSVAFTLCQSEPGTLHSPKLQHDWNVTIRLFSAISWTHVDRRVTPQQRGIQCILQPQSTGQWQLQIQIDHQTPIRSPDLVLINKRTNLPSGRFFRSSWLRSDYAKSENVVTRLLLKCWITVEH